MSVMDGNVLSTIVANTRTFILTHISAEVAETRCGMLNSLRSRRWVGGRARQGPKKCPAGGGAFDGSFACGTCTTVHQPGWPKENQIGSKLAFLRPIELQCIPRYVLTAGSVRCDLIEPVHGARRLGGLEHGVPHRRDAYEGLEPDSGVLHVDRRAPWPRPTKRRLDYRGERG